MPAAPHDTQAPARRTALVWLVAPVLISCATAAPEIRVDHENGTLKAAGKTIEDGDEISLRTGTLQVVVENTNTAAYRYDLQSERTESKDIKALGSFLKAFAPYLTETPTQLLGDNNIDSRSLLETLKSSTTAALEQAVRKFDRLIVDEGGLRALHLLALRDLSAFAAGGPINVRRNAVSACRRYDQGTMFTKALNCDDDGEQRASHNRSVQLALSDSLAVSTEEVRVELARLQNREIPTDAKDLIAHANSIVQNGDDMIAASFSVRVLLLQVAAADSIYKAKLPLTWDEGRKLTLKVSANPVAELGRYADLPDIHATIKVNPLWYVRPSVGLAVLFAPNASYPTYKTRQQGTMFRVVEAGDQDERLGYGLTLGLTPWLLDDRAGSGWAAWLEGTINPVTDKRTLAIGGAVSWRIVKVGAGARWDRRQFLSGSRLDDLLTSADELEVDKRYDFGAPAFYVSLSVIGWEPFVAK